MISVKKRTAIKALVALVALALGAACSLAFAAQVVGAVVNLTGPLLAKKGNGTVKVLALKSEVEQGDTLISEKNTFAQIRFVDNSEITLKPNTTFKIETLAFDAGKPDGDSASFNLVKGALRSMTGLLGKRNKEKFQLRTPTATIGIRGTTFIVEYVGENASDLPAALEPGLHLQVLDGVIFASNPAGGQVFNAGQSGFVGSMTSAPRVVPVNSGLRFSAPPAFDVASQVGNTGISMTDTVDCEVR